MYRNMAGQGSVFRQRSISHEIQDIIREKLSNVAPGNSLEDLKAVIERLSAVTTTFESVLADVIAQDQEPPLKSNASPIVKEMKNVLEWAELLNTTADTTSSEPEYLFRAYKYTGTETGRPTFTPEIDVPFSLVHRRTIPVDEFIRDLAGHLSKTRMETETYFVSMSPMLEWTLHKAGQIRRENPSENVGLAIFDVTKLRSNSDTTIFRVWDILEFLIQNSKEYMIPQDVSRWAKNCDEYVSVGKIPDNGLVRWVKWEELYPSPVTPSPVTVISSMFVWSYTIKVFRDKVVQQTLEIDDICGRIVNLGKALAGPHDNLILPLALLILKPTIRFWGFSTEMSDDVIEARIHDLLDDTAAEKIVKLNIKD